MFLLSEIEIQLLKKEYEKKMVNKYSVPWCFTNHAGHEKELFFSISWRWAAEEHCLDFQIVVMPKNSSTS